MSNELPNKHLYKLSLAKAQELLVQRQISSYELTHSVFNRIEEVEAKINAYTTLINKSVALKQTKLADKKLKNKSGNTNLTGIPYAIKDSFVTKGVPSTAASNVLKSYVGQYDSTVSAKLNAAGAILVGKTNLDEFCMGFTTETSCFGPTSNPWDTTRVPGGSSGGSAAAVAAGMCMFAIGSEHYDSIRQPAAWCGVVGLKPTYGAVSRYGIIAMASSLECPGPISKTVEDAALVLSVIYGRDLHDANTYSTEEKKTFIARDTQNKIKIGISLEYLEDFVDEDVLSIFKKALKAIAKLNVEVTEIKLPPIKHTTSIFEVLYRSEVASNLARYDGIRYPKSTKKFETLDNLYNSTRVKFGPMLKYLMITELRSLSGGEFDCIYKDALKMRTLIDDYFSNVFKKVDFIISPMSPCLAFKKGFYQGGRYKSTPKTNKYRPFIDMVAQLPSLSGFPGISVPCGFAKGLPVGLNIYGPRYSEQGLINLAYKYQQNSK